MRTLNGGDYIVKIVAGIAFAGGTLSAGTFYAGSLGLTGTATVGKTAEGNILVLNSSSSWER